MTGNIGLLTAISIITATAFLVLAICHVALRKKHRQLLNLEKNQREASKRELETSELRLQAAQRLGSIGHYEWEVQTDRLWCSPRIVEIFELKKGNVRANLESAVSAAIPQHQEFVRRSLHAALYEQQPYDIEYAIIAPSGKEHWIHSRAQVEWDAKGNPLVMRGTMQEITQRKQAELALKEQINLLDTLTSSLPTPVYMKDCDGTFTSCNKAFADLLGKPIDQVVGATMEELFTPELAKVYRDADQRLLQKGDVQTYEGHFVDHLGNVHDMEFRKALYRTNEGDIGGIIGSMVDITDRLRNEKALKDSEHLLEEAQKIAQVGHWAWDLDQRDIIASDQMRRIYGFSESAYCDTLPLKELRAAIDPDDLTKLDTLFEQSVATGQTTFHIRHKIKDIKNQKPRYIDTRIEIIRNEQGTPIRAQGTCQDVTRQQQFEDNLRVFSRALEQSSTAILITDTSGKIVYVNPAFELTSGYSEREALYNYPWLMQTKINDQLLDADLLTTVQNEQDWEGELLSQSRNGNWYWEHASISPVRDNEGNITQYVWVREDITLRKEQEQRLHHQANFDVLTELPNRALAMDRLGQTIKHAERNHLKAAVMFVDLDGFKKINDTLGHETGDQLLVQAASRLSNSVRESDTVARLGGDEFLVILTDIHDENDAKHVASNMLDQFNRPFTIDQRDLIITTSIGITIYPDDSTMPSDLLRNSDAAMYRSKQAGRNTYSFFTKQMNDAAQLRLEMETQMRKALDQHGFDLAYQPIISCETGQIARMEALLRWNDPVLGFVGPDVFVPLAEDNGMIGALGAWVIEESCRQARYWIDKGILTDFKMAINVSPRQFRDHDLIDTIKWNLSRFELNAHFLEIEVTEGLLLYDWPDTDKMIDELDYMGINISIDDFGTGYSSLSYLKRYPFDTLKIDRAFIKDITTDSEDAALVSAMIAMAKALDLQVIAEGVETREHAEFLVQKGCSFMQGYYFAKPMNPDDFERWLDTPMPKIKWA